MPAPRRSVILDIYPADEDAAYAQYLMALSYYDQIDEVGRDQGLTFQALQALRDRDREIPRQRICTLGDSEIRSGL